MRLFTLIVLAFYAFVIGTSVSDIVDGSFPYWQVITIAYITWSNIWVRVKAKKLASKEKVED